MNKRIIAVQEGLHQVAALLKKEGYPVTTIDDSSLPIDVIIYSSQNNDYIAHNMSGRLEVPANNEFVKMINIDEIGIDNLISTIEEIY